MSAPNPDVDAYIAGLAADRQEPMRQLRETIRAAAPDADEVITYRMPGFKAGATFLVSYDAFKAHYSLFPSNDRIIAELGNEVLPHVKGRGTLQFAASEPLPLDLIRRIVEIRVREVAEGAAVAPSPDPPG
ncbi:MAG TPA: DUF1801 domain-containing protein [Candidatus Limnocylindrales bacterium]|jgi:uncharacterized protein YdhG (YjbR/CyaY superfamily)